MKMYDRQYYTKRDSFLANRECDIQGISSFKTYSDNQKPLEYKVEFWTQVMTLNSHII